MINTHPLMWYIIETIQWKKIGHSIYNLLISYRHFEMDVFFFWEDIEFEDKTGICNYTECQQIFFLLIFLLLFWDYELKLWYPIDRNNTNLYFDGPYQLYRRRWNYFLRGEDKHRKSFVYSKRNPLEILGKSFGNTMKILWKS